MEEEENVFAASVPGCIQADYAKANTFGDVNFGYNVKKSDQIELKIIRGFMKQNLHMINRMMSDCFLSVTE